MTSPGPINILYAYNDTNLRDGDAAVSRASVGAVRVQHFSCSSGAKAPIPLHQYGRPAWLQAGSRRLPCNQEVRYGPRIVFL
jgi:hypothetical protein